MRVGFVLAFSAVLFLPQVAEAWVRTATCRPATGMGDPLACRDGETPIPIYWDVDRVVYRINEVGTSDLAFDDVTAAIQRSFDTWSDVACSGLRLVYGGLTSENRVGFDQDSVQTNSNVVMFIDSGWRHQGAALALTSVTYSMTTGEIVDADIELNDQSFTFTTSDVPGEIEIDLENTVTHEAGHVVGFDHSSVAEATMLATAPPGEIQMRDLHQDDIDGLCAVYPSGGQGGDNDEDDDCACNANQSNSTVGYLAMLLLFLGLFARPRFLRQGQRKGFGGQWSR